jgi:hypothetical protein
MLVTVVYLRQLCSQNVLSDLLDINANSIGQVIFDTRQLLGEHGRVIDAAALRFRTAARLRDFVASSPCPPTRSQVSGLLSIGTDRHARTELSALTERVRHVLEARNERHRHRRRGGARLPGARGGVFTQKITHDERVLAIGLYRRTLCTQALSRNSFSTSAATLSVTSSAKLVPS